jgi:hypothetical protein
MSLGEWLLTLSRILVPQGQAVQEDFFLGVADTEDGGTTWSEGAQAGCYMIKHLRKGNGTI